MQIIAEFKEEVEDETPLKLKYDPDLTTSPMRAIKGDDMQVSLEGDSVVTELDITPISVASSSAGVEDSGSICKRRNEEKEDAPLERKKRSRLRPVKMEKL